MMFKIAEKNNLLIKIALFLLIGLIGLLLSWNIPSSAVQEDASTTQGENNESDQKVMSIEEIKKKYDENMIVNIFTQEPYALVEIKREGVNFANYFELYNLNTGEKSVVYTSELYANFYEMDVDSEHKTITFLATGSNHINGVVDFPFAIICKKNESGYVFTKKDRYLPLDQKANFGSKFDEIISDVRVTINGLQVAFQPIPGKESNFHAAYIDIPHTNTFYNQEDHQMIFEFQRTKISDEFKSNHIQFKGNDFIKSIALQEIDDNSRLIINLTDKAVDCYYNTSREKVGNETPYVDIKFQRMDVLEWQDNIFP